MPIYEYQCPVCGKRFEETRSISAAGAVATCPFCQAQTFERLISVPAKGIVK
jgi:putative FmdB family regulatory protein